MLCQTRLHIGRTNTAWCTPFYCDCFVFNALFGASGQYHVGVLYDRMCVTRMEYFHIIVRTRAGILLLFHRNAGHSRAGQIVMRQNQMSHFVGEFARLHGMNFD